MNNYKSIVWFSLVVILFGVSYCAYAADYDVNPATIHTLSTTCVDLNDCDENCDSASDTLTITWSATGGTFLGGNTGTSVTWQAPFTAGEVTITATCDDDGAVNDDCPDSTSITVEVVECVSHAIVDVVDLDGCAQRVTDPCYPGPVANGCGGADGPSVPDNPARECPNLTLLCIGDNLDCVSTDFAATACNPHDICYGTCETDNGSGAKSLCDAKFGADMHTVCNNLIGDEKISCYDDCDWWASTYSLAVYLIGGGAFESSQIAACSCTDCY